MRQHGSDIFIGDLARAVAALGGDDLQTAAVAGLLGFRIEPPGSAPTPEEQRLLEPEEVGPQPPSVQADPREARAEASEPAVESPATEYLEYDVVEPEVEYVRAAKKTAPPAAPSWPAWERAAPAGPRHLPLFLPQWTRGVLSEVAATWRAAGAVDVPHALEVLARGTTPAELPRIYTPTLARGCRVLVDVGEGMAPFARDCWQLIAALRSVVGHELVEVFYFKDCPVFGVETEVDTRLVPFRSPPRATPVLLLSDLGIATPSFSLRRAAARDWLQLAQELYLAACPLLALVPYPRYRWPRGLVKALTVIQWDRCTTASSVRRAKEEY
ncbi:MAG: hypothetical protein JO360_08500 [Acidobacteria bacterium]|nr:hypothetical protein [Acidobacteriota bacterium]